MGTAPFFWLSALLLLWDESVSDRCWEYVTGGGEPGFPWQPEAPLEFPDLGELLPLLLDLGVDSREGFFPALEYEINKTTKSTEPALFTW